MEVITYNNNFRLAIPIESKAGFGVYNGVITFDVDPISGDFIPGSNKLIRYSYSSGSVPRVEIKGVEFSQSGEKIYIVHNAVPNYTGTIDRFDLTNVNPSSTLQIVSSDGIYKDSHIERISNDGIIIPTQNNMKLLNNSSSVALPSISNLFSLIAYNSVSPFTSGAAPDDYARLLQHQVDDMDYVSYLTEGVQCCLDNQNYNQFVFSATANATWIPSFNPLNGSSGIDVYIRNELRIPAGKTITIQGMNLHFAPGARLVIENSLTAGGQGGKLILDGTTLTVDDRCTQNKMWLGVEVWGNQTWSQGTWASSTQGRLELKNSSKIEHAWVGVLVSQRNSISTEICQGVFETNVSPFSFNNARDGGIVKASGKSIFFNNQRGVHFRPYFALGGLNNLSTFTDVTFEWNGPLKESNYQDHAKLDEVKGISFKGCGFLNTTLQDYVLAPIGSGINARESQFYVTVYCPVIGPVGTPCVGEIPNTFKNLQIGIFTTNSNGLSFKCDKSNFIDNSGGILVLGTQGEKVTSNNFSIRESDQFQTVGLAMFGSSGYTVENNTLYEFDNSSVPNGAALSYGIVVNNSGPVENNIYRNYFHDLMIGGQTEKNNAILITPANDPLLGNPYTVRGLKWKCNDFVSTINEHDLTLMQGQMRYLQGESGGGSTPLDTRQRTANNKFSLTNELISDEHDILVSDESQRFKYAYIDAPRHKPDSYTLINTVNSVPVNSPVDPNQTLWAGSLILTDAGSCPSGLDPKLKAFADAEKIAIKNQIEVLKNRIDGGNTQTLINLINTGSNGPVKNTLLAASPYLSDAVLLAYIAKHPPIGNLKQVLLANSQLSSTVKAVLLNVSMPSGTANQIASAQTAYSPRVKLGFEIDYLQSKYEEIYNAQYSDLLLNDAENADFTDLILLLKEEQDKKRLELLFKTYVLTKDTLNATTTKVALENTDASIELNALATIQKTAMTNISTCCALGMNSSLVNDLYSLKMSTNDEVIACQAMCMLRTIEDTIIIPEFIMETNSSHAMTTMNQGAENEISLSRSFSVHVYPNPTSGEIYIDYPNLETGILKIQVVDLNGRIVANFESASLSNAEVINIETLEKGVYSIKLYLNNEYIETQKVILK